MKLVLVISLCLFFAFNAFAQTDETIKNTESSVEEITLARDDGSGQAGETSEKFNITDRPIYCILQIASTKTVAVKMILVAVKASGLKPETKIVTLNYMTQKDETGVTFNFSPGKGIWVAGDYRIDVFLDGKLSKSQTFQIEKSSKTIEKQIAPKSFAPRGKNVQKPRKN